MDACSILPGYTSISGYTTMSNGLETCGQNPRTVYPTPLRFGGYKDRRGHTR
jgi:hypothetical protein